MNILTVQGKLSVYQSVKFVNFKNYCFHLFFEPYCEKFYFVSETVTSGPHCVHKIYSLKNFLTFTLSISANFKKTLGKNRKTLHFVTLMVKRANSIELKIQTWILRNVTTFKEAEIYLLNIYFIYMRYNMTLTELQLQQLKQTGSSQQVLPTGGQTSPAVNSVIEEGLKNYRSEKPKIEVSKFDQKLEQLCADFSKYGLTPQMIKNSGILATISGKNPIQIQNSTEDEQQKILDSLKAAIKDSVVNGKVDLDLAAKKGKDYNLALNGEWKSIDGFKKENAKNSESLSARMERFFGLKKGSFNNLPQEKVEEYLERYFNKYFLDKVKHSKNPEETYKAQLRDFTKLLINTEDKDKGIFRQAIISLLSSNRVKGLEAVIMSFDSQEVCTKWANECDSDYCEKLGTKADGEGKVPSKSENTAAVALITSKKDAEHIKIDTEATQEKAKTFFEKNKDILETIKEKEEKQIPLTKEEEQIARMRDYFIAAKSGEISGTAINEIIEQSVKETLLTHMNNNAYELSPEIYKEIVTQVTEFVEGHPELLTISKEEFAKLLDKATNGNYTNIIENGENAVIKSPGSVQTSEEQEIPQTDYGFQSADSNRVEIAKAYLSNVTIPTEKKTQPQIEAIKPVNTDEPSSFEQIPSDNRGFMAYIRHNGINTYIIDKYKELSNGVQQLVINTIARYDDKNMVNVLNSNSRVKLRHDVCAAKGGFQQDFIEKLTAVSSAEKASLKMMSHKDEEKPFPYMA